MENIKVSATGQNKSDSVMETENYFFPYCSFIRRTLQDHAYNYSFSSVIHRLPIALGVPTLSPWVDCKFLKDNIGFQIPFLMFHSMQHKAETIEGDV